MRFARGAPSCLAREDRHMELGAVGLLQKALHGLEQSQAVFFHDDGVSAFR
jgi:hypothetical protein